MFVEVEKNKPQKSKVLISYQIYSSFESNELIDSASSTLEIFRKYKQKNVLYNFNMNDDTLSNYLVKIYVTDIFRRKTFHSYLTVNKKNNRTSQNFIVLEAKTFKPYYGNYFRPKKNYIIRNDRQNPDSLFISYYKKQRLPAAPPFSSLVQTFDKKPDSVYRQKYNNGIIFSTKSKGMYFIQNDTSHTEGLAKGIFNTYYPLVKSTSDMLEPLQYLTSSKEFAKLNKLENKKLGIDNFWLKAAGNYDEARELIKIFYNRVTFANLYFASYTEGWKTDRGMIYIIFGPPKMVSKKAAGEKWIYSDNRNYKSLIFEFERKSNNFSDNEYVLIRSINYKSDWYRAVDTWRKGKVYSFPK